MSQDVELAQNMIDKFFESDPNLLVRHHLDSYNQFMEGGIEQLFRETNPIQIMKQEDKKTRRFRLRANLYAGGKDGSKIYYGKPVIHDEGREHYMYPNEARLRNMTYAITVHYDVEIDFFTFNPDEDIPEDSEPTRTITLSKIFLGRIPIMLMSKLCILQGLSPSVRFEMGECRNDYGGYFIIDGKEKCIVSQEKFASNMLNVRNKVNDTYLCSADVRSVSDDASKHVRTVSVRVVAPTPALKNGQMVVLVPNVRKPVPLFILMRALGVESDKAIIQTCLLDMERYASYMDDFIPSIYDAGKIFNREMALKYIATLTKGKTIAHVVEILSNYFLPHVGAMNFDTKAYYVGHMVREVLKVYKKDNAPTDRDSFRFKRIDLPGTLLSDLLKEYYAEQRKVVFQRIDKKYYYNKGLYNKTPQAFIDLIMKNYEEFFSERVVNDGFRKAFKGNWGATENTKRLGIVQGLNRLSYNAAVSHLRKINLPLDSSAKVIGPRLLHSSQWGIIDPVDTPDGGNVGLHKHMAIAARITSGCPSSIITQWLQEKKMVTPLHASSIDRIGLSTKVFVNGAWIGTVTNPEDVTKRVVEARRRGEVNAYTSIYWDIRSETIEIYTDPGRMCRPLFYVTNQEPSYQIAGMQEDLVLGRFSWNMLVHPDGKGARCATGKEAPLKNAAVIEYLDTAEQEGALIATEVGLLPSKPYTHLEIHPSFILGVMGNQVVFPENNQLPRDLFACGQMRQAVSLYHSNFQTRIDKMGVVLNAGQIPLLKSRYLEKISHEQHPYGENVIAAIMCYGGYNVEDSILFNEGSVKRGMFRTTYYNMYESREESSKVGTTQVDTRFADVQASEVVGLKPGYDYGALDERGLVRENTPVTENTVMIGRVTTNLADPDTSTDASVFAKKGQLGRVDKAFITEGEEGFRIAKVRVRHERVPSIGDKFCSRCGQKGTIGLVIPEESMPFTEDGLRPDIIVNPHALPSRMTIGQLVETLTGKACSMYGGFGDCTAFMNKGPKDKTFGSMLQKVGFNSTGNQILYNGETGEQLGAEVFIGPTYYMRLKHMVKDKINYRARGPRTVLTRQTVQGRANDGGLRVGEMERDAVIAHGATKFLQESMLVRGDEYFMAVCNQTGTVAVYNESYDLFLSPLSDGPIRFTETVDEGMNVQNVSRFGRSFSILRIPYSFKLLLQELQTMNVSMRIITDQNVDQLTSLQFSNREIGEVLENARSMAESTDALPEPEDRSVSQLEDVTERLVSEATSMAASAAPVASMAAPSPVTSAAAAPSPVTSMADGENEADDENEDDDENESDPTKRLTLLTSMSEKPEDEGENEEGAESKKSIRIDQ